MKKRNVYLVQVTAEYETTVMLPYSVGALAAYAWNLDIINENYSLERIICRRESIEEAVNSLLEPFLVGFSNCVWNFEYNKALARMVKIKYPDCQIIFGGHNIPFNRSLLDENPFIDYLVHGEGEEAFAEILKVFLKKSNSSDIDNISYRSTDGICFMNKISPVFRTDFPSPYLSGVFDQILENNKIGYIAFFETNRGCPYPCTYCDWQTLKTKVRNFPLERIMAEIEWIAEHKIEYCGSSDANFGICKRDEFIADRLVEIKDKTGYPKKFQVSYAKNSNMTVYNINKKLNDAGMCKGVTLSLQSLSPVVLENIGRRNMTLEKFSELITMYEKAVIPTYTELIIGLPGETYDSFCRGIGIMFESGQHTSVIVNNCDLLINTALASKESIEKYGIKWISAQYSKEHSELFTMEIPEFSDIIIATNTMDSRMWVDARLFSIFSQALHCMGLLRCFAIYLFHEKNIPYEVFYKMLLEYFAQSKTLICGSIYAEMKSRLESFTVNGETMYKINPLFGKITWPLEESIFLEFVSKQVEFFADAESFLSKFEIEKDIYADLMAYQKSILKLPGKTDFSLALKFDLYKYFSSIYINSRCPLEKIENILSINDTSPPADWKDFAREIVWYGRKSSKNVYTDITVKYI